MKKLVIFAAACLLASSAFAAAKTAAKTAKKDEAKPTSEFVGVDSEAERPK